LSPVRLSATARHVVTLRTARVFEVSALAEMDEECFGARAWPFRAWWEAVHEPEWITLVAEDRCGELLAAAVLLPLPPVASLASLAVRPPWRRNGLGTALLAEAVERMRRAHVRWVGLEVDASQAGAIRLYRRAGFGLQRRFREDGLLRLGMIRRLRREGRRDQARPRPQPLARRTDIMSFP
jgi:ribosomal-protein-alanine N-acetyltransferase